MGIYSGKVLDDGKVLDHGALLPSGTHVTLLVPEAEEPFDHSPDMEAEHDASRAQIERGEYVTWPELRERLAEIEKGVSHAKDQR